MTGLNSFTLMHCGSRTPLPTLKHHLTASAPRLSTDCLLGFVGQGIPPLLFYQRRTGAPRITPCLENGKAAFINILDKEEVAFGSTEFIVFHSKGILPNEFFYCLIKTDDFRKFIIKRLTGTSGRQRISADDVGKYPLPIFLDDQIKYFNKTLPLLFSCIASYGRQNSTLRRLQDALLDKLIYGEIRIQK